MKNIDLRLFKPLSLALIIHNCYALILFLDYILQQQSQEEDTNDSPMSPSGNNSKVRRKLPTIPTGVEPVLPASKRKGKAPDPPASTMKKGPAAKKGKAPEPPPKPSPKKNQHLSPHHVKGEDLRVSKIWWQASNKLHLP